MLQTDVAYDLAVCCDCPLVTNSLLFQLLTADPKSAGERKEMLPEEKAKSTNLMTLWDFEGVLKYSPIFYGYYTNRDGTRNGYRLPFAYFMTGLAVYIYSFVATLKRYGLYWPVHCMPANAVYSGQYSSTLVNTLYTGKYAVHWPVYKSTDQCTLHTGHHTVHWPIHCTLANELYTGQYTVHWPIHCTLANTLYTGQYTVHWPIHFTLTIIL